MLQLRNYGEVVYLTCRHPLAPYPVSLTAKLEFWAREAPDRVFLAVREGNSSWRTITYAAFRREARGVAQGLLDRGLSSDRPIAILLGNGIEHAVAGIAAMYVGIPYAPVPPSLSPESVLRLLQAQLVLSTADQVWDLRAEETGGEVDAAHGRLTGDTLAKVLFTSGSGGVPNGVRNTHRMLVSNQEMIRWAIPSLRAKPPVLCDWLPWHHTYGGNHNFGLVLYNGGTLYLDEGRPVAGEMETSIRNLVEVAPTLYFNVPQGFEMLADFLGRDGTFRDRFVSRLELMFCAGASLPREVRDRLARFSAVPLVTGYGATETAPMATFSHGDGIGLPVPGVELKLAPEAGRLSLRIRGPNVTPGYFGDDALTQDAFDSEGFWKTGDAVRFANPNDPSCGLIFDGRTGDDFKLSSGTWVHAALLREEVLKLCAPLVREVLLAGEDRNDVTALVFPNPEEVARPGFEEELTARLKNLAAASPGSSRRIARVVIQTEPLSRERGEITEKGTVNRRAVLAARSSVAAALYASPPPAGVIVIVE